MEEKLGEDCLLLSKMRWIQAQDTVLVHAITVSRLGDVTLSPPIQE